MPTIEHKLEISEVVEAMKFLGIPSKGMVKKLQSMEVKPLRKRDIDKMYRVVRFIFNINAEDGDVVGFEPSIFNLNTIIITFETEEPDAKREPRSLIN
ncbi:MAG TPA: hypothetical protein VLH19_00545 [Patescibacteria group bacterium]|nr:hypothetical protein [Patescibacteria group bacterium]